MRKKIDKIKECLKKYQKACDDVANVFCEKHGFEKLTDENTNTFWINNERGSSLFCGEFNFTMDEIIAALEINATTQELLDFISYNKPKFNFKTFTLINR